MARLGKGRTFFSWAGEGAGSGSGSGSGAERTEVVARFRKGRTLFFRGGGGGQVRVRVRPGRVMIQRPHFSQGPFRILPPISKYFKQEKYKNTFFPNQPIKQISPFFSFYAGTRMVFFCRLTPPNLAIGEEDAKMRSTGQTIANQPQYQPRTGPRLLQTLQLRVKG